MSDQATPAARASVATRGSNEVTLSRVQDAFRRIRDAISVSPCSQSHALTRITGCPVFLKLENLQRTGAFKERGALNKLLLLGPDERNRGLIAASAGNRAGSAIEWLRGKTRAYSAAAKP